jgi:hypothetical protein
MSSRGSLRGSSKHSSRGRSRGRSRTPPGSRYGPLPSSGYGYGPPPRSGYGPLLSPISEYRSVASSGSRPTDRAGSKFEPRPGSVAQSGSRDVFRFESGCMSESGSESRCISDPVPDKYKIFHTTDEINDLLQTEMTVALTDKLIEQIKDELTKAIEAQNQIDQTADYFTKVFTGYKEYVENQTEDSRILETKFSTKLKILKDVFPNASSDFSFVRNRTLSTHAQDARSESLVRNFGPSNLANTKAIFEEAIDKYKGYLLNKFVYGGHRITVPPSFSCGNIERYIEDAFNSLYPDGNNIRNKIPCIRIKTITIQGQECELFLTITPDKIELICNLKDPHNPVFQCAFYRSKDGKSLMFIVKITGRPGFKNAHITLVLPIRSRWDPRINTASPHMTFTHKTPEEPEVRIYFDCSEKCFYLGSMLTKFGEYIDNPDNTMIGLLKSMHAEHIKHLQNVLDRERERGKRRPVGTGGSTNKILKIKEQIKIIRGKYKTTKLDKYLIQIDKLKEKIEQLKLKDKKNKIKEQIKEVKALHKLNPKKAYVNKIIKLKEKLNNM